MITTRCSDRWQAAALATLLATALGTGQATAAMLHDPALPYLSTSTQSLIRGPCRLTRVGTQFVRCDNLTGNAVPAPRWVTQR